MEKVIFLVDMNAFFISCEATRDPSLAEKPAAVAGDPKRRSGIILAANYKARAYGVRTAMVLHEALKRCPDMLLVPPDHDFYEEKSRSVMSSLSHFSPLIEQNSIDEAWLDMTGTEAIHGPSMTAAKTIMKTIHETQGLGCSIGIAPNKFLAKIAAEMKKPRGITQLALSDVPDRIWPLPVGKLYGVGAKTVQHLARYGIQTVGDLARVDRDFLLKHFGKNGMTLHEHAHGRDYSPVCPRHTEQAQSIGRSTTLPEDLTDIEQARTILLKLADEVAHTARCQKKKGHTVQLTLKYNDFTVITRQVRIPKTALTQAVYAAGCRLMENNWDRERPVRLIGISLSGFDDASDRQLTVFDLLDQKEGADRNERLEKTMDDLRQRFGPGHVTYGKLVEKQKDRSEKKGRNSHDH
jgi:DNA polymerase IV